ncbi:hypothetical protein GJ496_001409 [Pomphorhynchus laevis]|nr:hypothetical protein GJ496_001409 [Pomphorhynchus laevis]
MVIDPTRHLDYRIKPKVQAWLLGDSQAYHTLSANRLKIWTNTIKQQARYTWITITLSFCGTVVFDNVGSDLEDPSRIFEIFDITATQLPAIRLIKIKGGLIKYKYEHENEISAVNLTYFVKKCLDNNIVSHYRSPKFLEDWNCGPVKTLVQSNIISVSHDPSKAVLVEFDASWCGICQRMEPV